MPSPPSLQDGRTELRESMWSRCSDASGCGLRYPKNYNYLEYIGYLVRLGHLHEFSRWRISHERKASFEKELTWIILRRSLIYLLNEYTININDCFYMKSEILRYPNPITFIYLRYYARYSGLQRFHNVIDAFIYLPFIAIQRNQIWRVRRPYV